MDYIIGMDSYIQYHEDLLDFATQVANGMAIHACVSNGYTAAVGCYIMGRDLSGHDIIHCNLASRNDLLWISYSMTLTASSYAELIQFGVSSSVWLLQSIARCTLVCLCMNLMYMLVYYDISPNNTMHQGINKPPS